MQSSLHSLERTKPAVNIAANNQILRNNINKAKYLNQIIIHGI